MRVNSFIQDRGEFRPVEVELALWPGLPTIQFLGRADAHLKESALRIKSAIKAAGFEFPVAQQIIVNLRPTYIQKSSRGLELAVACGYLWMTGQLEAPKIDGSLFVYGELSLFGEVGAPSDLGRINIEETFCILTGRADAQASHANSDLAATSKASQALSFDLLQVFHLSSLGSPNFVPKSTHSFSHTRPVQFDDLVFSSAEAELLCLLAVGGHHALLAGPAGGGKSTLARVVSALLPPPQERELKTVNRLNPELNWWPVIEPHHSTPRMAMIGGGSWPRPGEVARAHLGILILDELLEFDRHVIESLREPFETGRLRVGRLAGVETFDAEIQILATTNLCPCGKYVPGRVNFERCRFTLKKCRSYSERLSGPLLDRFQIVYFVESRSKREVTFQQILERVAKGRERSRARVLAAAKGNPNGRTQHRALNRVLTDRELKNCLSCEAAVIGMDRPFRTERRRLATLRVAWTLANLDDSDCIEIEHVSRAVKWTNEPFDRMERWD